MFAILSLARSKSQGFAHTPQERRAFENHAMTAAQNYFRSKGLDLGNVSAGRSYDLLCRQGTNELHVEVKGTTPDGDAIVLAHNEVKHACDPRNACVLLVLHSIRLAGGKVSGRKQRIMNRWQLLRAQLTPVSYNTNRPIR